MAGDGDAGAAVDAAPTTADGAGACPAPLHVEIAVNGALAELGPGEPFAHVLVGDTVALSAAGTCVQRGPISYEWQVSPIDSTRATALPDLTSPEITVYSEVADRSYTVRLTITDGDGQTTQKLVYAFATHGWQELDQPGDVDTKDVHFGGGALWVGTVDGAFRYDPGADAFESLVDDWSFTDSGALVDDTFTDEIEHVWYDDDDDYVWLAHKDARAGVWRGTPATRVLDFVRFDGVFALAAPTQVNDIGPADPGVRIATDLGVTSAADNSTFDGRVAPLGLAVESLALADGRAWLAGTKLWAFDEPLGELDPFGAGIENSKIVGMIAPAATGELWLVSDVFGVATASAETGLVDRVFTDADGLPSNKARDLVVDSAEGGDIWIATQKGVARYKRDRARWIAMGANEGLAGHLDLRAITVDPEARAFYAAGSKGLVYIRAP